MSSEGFVLPPKEKIRKKYIERKEAYSQLISEVKYIIEKALEKTQIKINNIEFRLKDFDSFYAKLIRKDYGGAPFDLIEDIAGIRIVCLYRSDLEKIEDIIKRNFRVLSSKTIRDTPLTFGYMSDHYIVCIPYKYTGIRYDSIKNLKCEIQVRTVSMHAWAIVSHQLDYKQEADIPTQFKNDFYALSGIFYVADSLFEQFRNARDESASILVKRAMDNEFNLDNEINLDTMIAFINWKFPDREYGHPDVVSTLLREIENVGIKNYRQLNKIIDKYMDWFIKHEKNTRARLMGEKYSGTGSVFTILARAKAKTLENGMENL